MVQTRRKHSNEFKVKVALEAIKEEQTLPELCRKYNLHGSLIKLWKTPLQKNAYLAFGVPVKGEKQHEEEVARLHQKIGQLTVERDFLSKALGH